MSGKTREAMKSEIARRRIREMFPMGFTVQDIAAVIGRTDTYTRLLIGQEFPDGRSTKTAEATAP